MLLCLQAKEKIITLLKLLELQQLITSEGYDCERDQEEQNNKQKYTEDIHIFSKFIHISLDSCL